MWADLIYVFIVFVICVLFLTILKCEFCWADEWLSGRFFNFKQNTLIVLS